MNTDLKKNALWVTKMDQYSDMCLLTKPTIQHFKKLVEKSTYKAAFTNFV